MKRFPWILLALATLSFCIGMRSVRDRELTGGAGGTLDNARRSEPIPANDQQNRVASAEKKHFQSPLLPDEVLDKVGFEKISGYEVTPVARKLLDLSDEQCERVRLLIVERDAALLTLREQEEHSAVGIAPDEDWHADLTWEIPIDVAARWQIRADFDDSAVEAVGAAAAARLFGEVGPKKLPDGQRRRRQVSVFHGGEYFGNFEYTEVAGRRYGAQRAKMSLERAEISDHLRGVIETAVVGLVGE